MDLRGADDGRQLKEIIDRAMLGVCTSIPAIVDSFDPTTLTVSATPAIQMRVYKNETYSWETLPKLVNIPVVIYGGGGFFQTIPIQQGDNCLLVFSQRAIDGWHDLGGFQPAGDDDTAGVRHHDMADAFALFSPQPITANIPNYATDAIELRNTAGTVNISVSSDGVTITALTSIIEVLNTGIINITGNVNITGNLAVNGIISDATTTLVAMRSTYDAHTHPYTDDGAPANTSPPSGLMG